MASALARSVDQKTDRAGGRSGRPRVPRSGRQMPRVLFSAPECRVVVIDLLSGEELGEHHVRERAVVEVISGSVSIDLTGQAVDCDAGTVVTFEPGERHAVRARADARLLLVLAPWTKVGHYSEGEPAHANVPANATVEPDRRTDPCAGRDHRPGARP